MSDAPRVYTADESRKIFLNHLSALAVYWARLDSEKTVLERCNGLIFSILAMIDGSSPGIPAIDMMMSPHPDDKEYNIEQGENYYEAGVVFNDCHLHGMWKNFECQD